MNTLAFLLTALTVATMVLILRPPRRQAATSVRPSHPTWAGMSDADLRPLATPVSPRRISWFDLGTARGEVAEVAEAA